MGEGVSRLGQAKPRLPQSCDVFGKLIKKPSVVFVYEDVWLRRHRESSPHNAAYTWSFVVQIVKVFIRMFGAICYGHNLLGGPILVPQYSSKLPRLGTIVDFVRIILIVPKVVVAHVLEPLARLGSHTNVARVSGNLFDGWQYILGEKCNVVHRPIIPDSASRSRRFTESPHALQVDKLARLYQSFHSAKPFTRDRHAFASHLQSLTPHPPSPPATS